MRNITDRQIRNALRMLYAGTDREKIAAAVNLRLDIINQIAVGDITPINAQIPRRKIPPRRWRAKFGDPSNPQHPLYRDSRVHGSNDGEKADGEEKGARSAKRRKRQV